jgi:hypothetical protein
MICIYIMPWLPVAIIFDKLVNMVMGPNGTLSIVSFVIC